MPELLPAGVVAEACGRTRLDDYGPDDFREGLAVLCESIDDEARLNELGDVAVRETVVNGLANRLRVFDWIRRHPEVARERIEAPIVVIGMFRAGTTFLSQLLDQDPHNRALLRWEAGDSAPPPSPANFRSGPRVDAARLSNDILEELNPRMKAIHHEDAAGATECIAVMSQGRLLQYDRPATLLTQPADSFVARMTGLSDRALKLLALTIAGEAALPGSSDGPRVASSASLREVLSELLWRRAPAASVVGEDGSLRGQLTVAAILARAHP